MQQLTLYVVVHNIKFINFYIHPSVLCFHQPTTWPLVCTPVRALPVVSSLSHRISVFVSYGGVARLWGRAAPALAPRRAITIPLWSTRWSMRRVTSAPTRSVKMTKQLAIYKSHLQSRPSVSLRVE